MPLKCVPKHDLWALISPNTKTGLSPPSLGAPSSLRHSISRQRTRPGARLDTPGASFELWFLSVARYRQFTMWLLSLCSAYPPLLHLSSSFLSSPPLSSVSFLASLFSLVSSRILFVLVSVSSRLPSPSPSSPSPLPLYFSLWHPPHVLYDVFIILTAALGRRPPQRFGAVVSVTMRCARMGETTRLCRIRSRSFLRRILFIYYSLFSNSTPTRLPYRAKCTPAHDPNAVNTKGRACRRSFAPFHIS